MKQFISNDFLLHSKTAEILYHEYAKDLPIIDYHNHLPPEEIASDKNFENLTKIWLDGDHYKWRAMRANGVDEKYITGDAGDFEKFKKWAETVPYTLRNPLYHWTHMELQEPFGIHALLNKETAEIVYNDCSEKLRTKPFSVHNLLRKANVEILCTTDDPIDSLEHHKKIKESDFEIKVLPTFRPDKAMVIEDVEIFNEYVTALSKISDVDISNYGDFCEALKKRHDFFHEMGCRLSDHGLDWIYAEDYNEQEIATIFLKAKLKKSLTTIEVSKFKSAMLVFLATLDSEKNWVQQFHLGALRNNNSSMMKKIGADGGYDSIGDVEQAKPLSKFLNKLEENGKLAKTILYNLNPKDSEVFAAMVGNFNNEAVIGKMQYGAAWWFLDQKDGMEKQMNVLSNFGLLSRFVGMLTDSRSFLSYSRHEYFRRILCNLLGEDVERGELPKDIELLGKMVQDICYYNAKNYFNF